MKLTFLSLGIAMCCLNGSAQLVFSATNLPSRVGTDYCRAYLNTAAVDVSGRLGSAGGPQRWDFSQPVAAGEIIRRTDIVAPSDGGHGAGFSTATYAERDTNESSGSQSWSYYRISTNIGRAYYGFYDANANPTCPRKLFTLPTIELPDGIYYGQAWSRTVDFPDCLDVAGLSLQLAVHFTSQSEVDAYGTLVLPGIGEVPALRVNEVNTYVITDTTFGFPIPTQVFRNYYWLVRGIGKAVLIGSDGSSTVPSANLTTAKTFLRVFEAANVTDRLIFQPVADLRLHLNAGRAVLNWRQETTPSDYRVEMSDNVAGTNWQLSALPATNTWSETGLATQPQRFFRVTFKP